MQQPMPSPLARHWDLDPEVIFLNHGSFGACPRVVMQRQQELRAQMEAQPLKFLYRDLEGMLDEARAPLARLIGCDSDDLAFVPNATTGVNTVLRSLTFRPGDELLVTDHEYNACRNALDFVAERSGAKVVVAKVPFPIDHPDTVVARVLEQVTARTRLLLIDHVTSPTGVVNPVEQLVAELRDQGVDTLVDGAHAPGMLPLNLDALGAAYYTGNCHKWLCTPKGSALLHVRRDRQEQIRPLNISHGANSQRADRSRFRLEFDFCGTADYTPFLCVPTALSFLQSLVPGGISALQRRNHALALAGRALLCEALDTPAPSPESMIGSLASVILPWSDEPVTMPQEIDKDQVMMWEGHRIEVPIMRWPALNLRLLRISPQAYNDIGQYAHLAEVVKTIV